MQIDATLLLAVGGIITGVFAFISSMTVNRRAARRDEVSMLREEVARLQARVDELTSANENWRTKYENLYNYIYMLRKTLVDHNITVPEMNIFDKNESGTAYPDTATHPGKKGKEKKIQL